MTEAAALELSVTRFIDAPPATVYRVYTERLEEWWAPAPWATKVIEMDLRAGGRFAFDMKGPEGESHPSDSVYLEVVPGARIVNTNAFTAGWTPKGRMESDCDFPCVTIVTFEPEGSGTRYTARVRHWTAEAVKAHEAMGFEPGWNMVTAQLAALAEAEAQAKAA
ncbi:MAG TPA: SRPBCC domain-containing protein [Allosphingosinicella sp.]|jgi:uncharacterized protein YndB with AHSA1/START domain